MQPHSPAPVGGFVPAAAVVVSALIAVRPPSKTTVSEWAERRRELRNKGAYSGPWRNTKVPYLVEPMNRTASRAVDLLVVAGPSQFAKTELALNVIGHAIEENPRDILVVQYSREMAIEFFGDRIAQKLLNANKHLRAKVGSEKSDDKAMQKRFVNGMRVVAAWPVSGQLAGRPVPVGILDERDRMPNDIDGEGDPVELLRKRTITFKRNGIVIVLSSPRGLSPKKAKPGAGASVSPILVLYYEGDQNLWAWPCLDCGEFFTPGFDENRNPTVDHLYIPKGATAEEARAASAIVCPHCGALHDEAAKTKMNAAGVWVPEGMAVTRAGQLVGARRATRKATYWFCGLASPFLEIGALAEELVVAREALDKTGDETKITACYNTGFGFPYTPKAARHDQALDVEELVERVEDYPLKVVPAAARFLIASVDVQGNRFEVLVRAYGPDLESWVVDRYSVFSTGAGDAARPLDPATRPEDWDLLIDKVVDRRYPLAGDPASTLRVFKIGLDSGAYTAQAYAFYRRLKGLGLARRVKLLKGASGRQAPRVLLSFPDSRRRDRKAAARGEIPVWIFNPNALKDELDGQMRRVEDGAGRLHFARGLLNDAPPHTFFEEITAEAKSPAGAWEKIKPRNESLDLLVMAHAVALSEKADRIAWENPPAWALPAPANSMVEAAPSAPADPSPDTPAPESDPAPPASSPAAVPPKPAPAPVQSRRPRGGGFVNRWKGF